MTIAELGVIGQLIQGLASIIVLITAFVAVRQLRISATTDLFHRFNDPVARGHRRYVYHNCKSLVIDSGIVSKFEKDKDILEHLEAVSNSLDWAGLLVKRGLLNKKDAIDLYGDSLIRAWVILRPWIGYTRGRRRSSPSWLWNHFEWLQSEAAKDSRFHSWIHDGVPIYTPDAIITIDYLTSRVISEDPIA
ncbi:MAG TPA: hypothetical protein DIW44_12360 [Anaerolineaceae bacterium]|nr:hypothetical protein [Anaerolineaceae bacterium]